MSIAKRLFDFYLDASIHVALAIFALVRVTCLTFNIPVPDHLSWFLFFGSIACYNFVKYGVEAEKYIMVADLHQRQIQWVSFVALGLAMYHAYFLSVEVYATITVLVLLTGLYAVPVLPHARNLRSLGGLKIFVVALVWAGATVILPIVALERSFTWDVGVETVHRFLFVLVLLIPFEIRDLAFDSPELRTLPQRFGVKTSKIIGAFAAFSLFLLVFLKEKTTTVELIAQGIVLAIIVLSIGLTRRHQPAYFSSFWVEAIPIIWWGTLYFLAKFFSG